MSIKPATEEKVAIIELSAEDKAKIARINPEIFITANSFPTGIRFAISEKESLSEEARGLVHGGILERS